MPSVLWRCWLGGRKGIRPVKNRVVRVLAWLSVWSEVQTCIWPSWCHCHSLSRLIFPFWYRLTLVVPDKGPLNGCVCVCVRLASYTICCRTSCTANWLYECLHYTTRCTAGCRTGSKVYTEFDCFVRYLWAVNLLCVMCSFGVRRAQRPMILHRKHYLVWKMDARIIGRQCRQSYTLLVMTAFVFKVVQYLCFIGSVFIVCWAVSI